MHTAVAHPVSDTCHDIYASSLTRVPSAAASPFFSHCERLNKAIGATTLVSPCVCASSASRCFRADLWQITTTPRAIFREMVVVTPAMLACGDSRQQSPDANVPYPVPATIQLVTSKSPRGRAKTKHHRKQGTRYADSFVPVTSVIRYQVPLVASLLVALHRLDTGWNQCSQCRGARYTVNRRRLHATKAQLMRGHSLAIVAVGPRCTSNLTTLGIGTCIVSLQLVMCDVICKGRTIYNRVSDSGNCAV